MRRHCLREFFCLAFTGSTWLSLAAAAFAEPAAQMFWTDRSTGRILRADLDGSNIQTIYQAPVFLDPYYFGVNRLAVDESQAVIYWSDTAAGTIQRMPLAGGAPQTIASGVVFPRDLEIDTAAGKLYWSAGTQVDAGGIVRANLDGSQLETLVPTILSPGIALDLQAGHLYLREVWSRRRTEHHSSGKHQRQLSAVARPLDQGPRRRRARSGRRKNVLRQRG